MWLSLRENATFLVASILVLGCGSWSSADDTEVNHELSLADLASYRAALAGKATVDDARASDLAVRVVFKDLWNRSEAFRGRRVTVEGRVQRIFRQGPVGSFPALSEIWIVSSTSDPFCLVVSQESGTTKRSVDDHSPEPRRTFHQIPKAGQMVRFTGTFLKIVRFPAGDGNRLAPLIVGNQPPVAVRDVARANGSHPLSTNDQGGGWAESPGSWLLGLTLMLVTAGAIARRHLRVNSERVELRNQRRKAATSLGNDPPLEFLEAPQQTLTFKSRHRDTFMQLAG